MIYMMIYFEEIGSREQRFSQPSVDPSAVLDTARLEAAARTQLVNGLINTLERWSNVAYALSCQLTGPRGQWLRQSLGRWNQGSHFSAQPKSAWCAMSPARTHAWSCFSGVPALLVFRCVIATKNERLIRQARSPTLPQVLLPIGDAPDDVFQRYVSLIMRHRQVRRLVPALSPPAAWCFTGYPPAKQSVTKAPHHLAVGGVEQRAFLLQRGPEKPLQVLSMEDWQHAPALPAGKLAPTSSCLAC